MQAETEREFGYDELFFSTTDRKGVIHSGNRVFARVAGHSLADMQGRAHNLIRHPDMPRAVFRVVWDYLAAGRPVAGYVKNLATDGRPYWVLATMVPTADGYLSVRLKPSTPYFDAAKQMYTELLALERAVEGDDVRKRKPSIEASVARMQELLAEAGFASYDEFMHAALPAEVLAREELVDVPARTRLAPHDGAEDSALLGIAQAAASAHDYLDELIREVGVYDKLGHSLGDKSHFISSLSDRIRMFALNALIAATRLGERGAALSAVAELMGTRSRAVAPIIERLDGRINAAVELLGDMGFRIATGKLQAEMIMAFARELLDGDQGGAEDRVSDLEALLTCLGDGSDRVISSQTQLDEALNGVTADAKALSSDLDVLRALQVNGRVEAARADGAEAVRDLFGTIADEVAEAREQMLGFQDAEAVLGRRRHSADVMLRCDLDATARQIELLR